SRSSGGSPRPSASWRRRGSSRAWWSTTGSRTPSTNWRRSCAPSSTPMRPGRILGMISPRIDRLLTQVDSNYASVIVAAKRARQINSYYHNLGEGTFDEFPPPMVDSASKNYLTIALEEVAEGKLKYHYR